MNNHHPIWKPVPGFENYYVIDPSGIVKSLHKNQTGHIIGQQIDRAGYLTVKLSKCGRDSTQYAHRLLALAFVPNPENKPMVNHINGNKLDNRLENLEWVTRSENVKHAFQTGLSTIGKKPVVDVCSGQRFESIKNASIQTGIPYPTLKNYLNGNRLNPTCLCLVNKAAA